MSMFYNAAVVCPLVLADDYTEGDKVIYINSNLKPTEAVMLYPELQVCPEIGQWARDSEALGDLQNKINAYSSEISDKLLGPNFLEEVFSALNEGATIDDIYVLLDNKEQALQSSRQAIEANLDKIYNLVNL